MLPKPSCVCRPISCPNISNLLPRVVIVNDVVIKSIKFNFCPVGLVPELKFIIAKLGMDNNGILTENDTTLSDNQCNWLSQQLLVVQRVSFEGSHVRFSDKIRSLPRWCRVLRREFSDVRR